MTLQCSVCGRENEYGQEGKAYTGHPCLSPKCSGLYKPKEQDFTKYIGEENATRSH